MSDIIPPTIPNNTAPNTGQANTGKATAALILGILSFIMCGCLTGIPAIILGRMYIRDVQAGLAPASQLGMAKAGYIMGIVSTILFCLVSILYIVVIVLGIYTGFSDFNI